jgi:hypothetical protein
VFDPQAGEALLQRCHVRVGLGSSDKLNVLGHDVFDCRRFWVLADEQAPANEVLLANDPQQSLIVPPHG